MPTTRSSATAVYVQPRWRVGASINASEDPFGDRSMHSVFAGLKTGPLSWLAEVSLIKDELPVRDRDVYATLLEGNWRLRKGHNLKFGYEFSSRPRSRRGPAGALQLRLGVLAASVRAVARRRAPLQRHSEHRGQQPRRGVRRATRVLLTRAVLRALRMTVADHGGPFRQSRSGPDVGFDAAARRCSILERKKRLSAPGGATIQPRIFDCTVACAVLLLASAAFGQRGAVDGEWRAYSGDLGASKYSPLEQIDESNVARCALPGGGRRSTRRSSQHAPLMRAGSTFRSTPLMIDGVLYAPNGVGFVEAFDAGTGKTLWVEPPLERGPGRLSRRLDARHRLLAQRRRRALARAAQRVPVRARSARPASRSRASATTAACTSPTAWAPTCATRGPARRS